MNGCRCFLLATGVLLGAVAAAAAAEAPVVSGASLTADGVTLVYGADFIGIHKSNVGWREPENPVFRPPATNLRSVPGPDGITSLRHNSAGKLAVHVTAPPPGTHQPPAEEPELRQSLARVLAGRPETPPAPAANDRGWRNVEHAEDNIFLCDAQGKASSYPPVVKLLRVRTAAGTSAPYVLNRPEIWGLAPRRPIIGDATQVWGANLAGWFALVDAQGRIAFLHKVYQSYQTQHYSRPESRFLKVLLVPPELPPGNYRLYCWNGMGDLGWSRGATVEIVARPGAPKNVISAAQHGAKGDGVTDDTEAIQRALDAVAKAGGGRAALPLGRYLISRTLVLPEGVELVGVSPEGCILQASPWKPFAGEIPERTFSRPEDYDPATYKPCGWGIDWVLEKRYKDRTCMAWLRSRCGLRNLTLEAGDSPRMAAVLLIADPQAKTCQGAVVDNCRIVSHRTGLYAKWPDYQVTNGILLPSSTDDLVIQGTHFSVNGECIEHMPGLTRWARIRHNRFENADPHGAFVLWIARTTQQCLIEGNVFENGGRAKTEQTHGYPYPVWRNCYVHNLVRNCNKGDGELLMYETGGVPWFGKVDRAETDRVTLAEAGASEWKPNHWAGHTAMVVAGRGLGQFAAVTASQGGTLTLDRPWAVAPGGGSTLALLRGGVIENVHIGNELSFSHYYCGVYGSGIRNAWVNEVFESVGGGTFLWPIHGPRIMALNVIYGNKYHERAGIVITNDRSAGGKLAGPALAAYPALVKCFGNEVRGCSIRERSYVSSENGQIFTRPVREHWARRGRSCPITPLPGTEPAIALWDSAGWGASAEDDKLDGLPASSRWNLLAENLITECPVGVLVGKAVQRSVLAGNVFLECPVPIRNLGRDTIEVDNKAYKPSEWPRPEAGKGQ